MLAKVAALAERYKAPRIACLGLAYKADTDDLRESPALDITHAVAARGLGEVLVVEPNIRSLPKVLSDAGCALTPLEEALDKADILVLLVDHKPFKTVSPGRLKEKAVVDTRGVWG